MEYLEKLSPVDLMAISFLPGNLPTDPADRIIIATARHYSFHIMTRDALISDYVKEGQVNAIAC